jgi:NodT family efflux transporter outer membrane factor (OMF) lipoprotein
MQAKLTPSPRSLCAGLAFLALCCALLATGCAVGPDFLRPAAQTPAAWLNAAGTTTTQTAAPTSVDLTVWWRAFNDPLLDSLIARALGANLDVQLAEQRIRQSRAVLGQTQAGLWPTLDGSGSYRRSTTHLPKTDSATPGVSVDRTYSTDLYQAGFDAAWELDIFGGTRRGIEASRADLQATVENLNNVLVTLTAEIGTSYMNLRALQERLRITHENLLTQEQSANITRKRFDAGFVSALDVTNAEAQVASTQAQIPTTEASIQQVIYQLSVLLGQEPGALVTELTPEQPLPEILQAIPAGLPSDLIERRPDIRLAESQLHAATARIGVAKADLFPRITLSGTAGAQANRLDSWSKSVTSSYAFGPAVSWNIFNGGLLWNRVRENRAVAEQALTTYRQTVLLSFQEVETAWVDYNRQLDRIQLLQRAVDRYRKALDLAQRLYTEGETEFLEVLTAERALFASQDSLVQTRNSAITSLVATYKALGGGWSQAPTP